MLLDKGIQCSSNEILQEVKRIFRANKAGHAGTLDVLASGLLPICFGEATKVSQYLLREKKSYTSQFIFGKTTRSGDLEGDVLLRKSTDFLTKELVAEAAAKFVGRIEQVPPMYSALKKNGIPLYKLARQGIELPREPREVQIYRFVLKEFAGPTAIFEIDCSKGTYVRQLAEDLGEELGCGACVSSLRRERLGNYDVSYAYTIGALREVAKSEGFAGLDKVLCGVDSALSGVPFTCISSSENVKLKTGQRVFTSREGPIGILRLYDEEGIFFGVGERLPDGTLITRRLIKHHSSLNIS